MCICKKCVINDGVSMRRVLVAMGDFAIFVVMEKVNRIIAVFLMALIGCVTVFQCHHHDSVGHPFFTTYFNNEITGGLHAGDCHSHDCDHDGHDGSAPCGMHLSEVLTDDDASDSSFDYTVIAFALPAALYDFDFSEAGNTPIIIYMSERREAGSPTEVMKRVTPRRGPPYDMI